MPQRGTSLKDTFVSVDTDATQTHINIQTHSIVWIHLFMQVTTCSCALISSVV